jgi:hypothetical protein
VSQVDDYVLELCQPPLYLCRLRKACANAPPNPGEPARNRELIFQFGNHLRISVSVKEAKCEGQPLPVGSNCQDVQQKNEQIICMSRDRRERFVVDDFEINQPRPASLLVINNVGRRRIGVRPEIAKFLAPELVGATKLAASRFQHRPRQCATVHVIPKAFTGQFVEAHGLCVRGKNAKTIAVEHLKAARFPALPVFDLAPEPNRYVRQAKVQIGQIAQLLAVTVAALQHHVPATANLLRD